MPEEIDTSITQKVSGRPLSTSDGLMLMTSPSETTEISIEPPSPPNVALKTTKKQATTVKAKSANVGGISRIHVLENQCRQLALSLFFHETAPVRSIGFTSSIDGEGKSFLSAVTAKVLSEVSSIPVTLVECNWHHSTLHEYYDLPSKPGLAEWLRGACNEADIRHQINHNLTIIPAGDGQQDVIRFLQQIRQKGLVDALAFSNELLIVDLPAIVTTHYGLLAASVVEALFIVVQAGVTPEHVIKETCTQLMNLPVQGFVLNQVKSSIPDWIRQIL